VIVSIFFYEDCEDPLCASIQPLQAIVVSSYVLAGLRLLAGQRQRGRGQLGVAITPNGELDRFVTVKADLHTCELMPSSIAQRRT